MALNNNPSPSPTNPLLSVGGAAAALIGWGFSRYAGASLWIPTLGAVLLALLFTKTPIAPKHFKGAIAVSGGHLIWFVVAAVLSGQWAAVGIDIGVLLGACVLVWLAPSLVTALLLGSFQLFALAFNVYTMLGVEMGATLHRALAVHILFRVVALIFITIGVLQLRRTPVIASATPTV